MQDEDLREQGEAAADFAKELAGRAQSLDEHSRPSRTGSARTAAWLIEREFGADVACRDPRRRPRPRRQIRSRPTDHRVSTHTSQSSDSVCRGLLGAN